VERREALQKVLHELTPDLLLLQECLDWTPQELHSFCGLPYSQLGRARPRGSGRCYHVGAASRWPLTGVVEHNNPAFLGHGLLEFEVNGLRCLAAHFDSHSENLRFVEARYVRSLQLEGPALLAGDLNCLSPRDPYPQNLAELLRQAGTQKYDLPPRTDTYAELVQQGWQDALYADGPPAGWVTAPRDRGGVRIDYRTDYIFTKGLTITSCRVHPLRGAESDHYPVVCDFTWPACS